MHPDLQACATGLFDRRRAVFLDQGKHSQDTANARLSLSVIDELADFADLDAGVAGTSQQLCRTQRYFLRLVLVFEAIGEASVDGPPFIPPSGTARTTVHVSCRYPDDSPRLTRRTHKSSMPAWTIG